MGALFLVNGLGVVLAAAQVGLGIGDARMPVLSIAAAVVFLAGLTVPFLGEWGNVRRGFRAAESSQVDKERQRLLPGRGGVEVFAPSGRDRASEAWRNERHPRRLLFLVAVAGYLLLAADVGLAIVSTPPTEIQERISNF